MTITLFLKSSSSPLIYMSERVLVVGGSGYVGQYICRDLPKILGDSFEFYATFHSNNVFQEKPDLFPFIKDAFKIQLDDSYNEIIELIQKLKPTFIVNPSAMSAVALCQEKSEQAYKVNDPSEWAKVAKENGCKRFIHFSTDMVYDGKQGPYSEKNESNPVQTMVYGLSKKKGEVNLVEKDPSCVILRSALVIGKPSVTGNSRGSTLEWMINALKNAKPEAPAKFFSNELRTPVLVDDIVRVIAKVIQLNDKIPRPFVANMGGDSECSRFDIGNGLRVRLGIPDNCLGSSLQQPLQGGIERPRDIRMDSTLLKTTLDIKMCTLDQSLDFIFGLKPHPYA